MNQNEHEALSAIVEQMKEDTQNHGEDVGWRELDGYRKQLEILLKMSKPTEALKFVPPEVQHRAEIDKARAEFRAQKNNGMKASDFMSKAVIEEEMIGEFVTLRGGNSHGMSVPAAKPSDPPGTHVVFAGEVYTLTVDRNFQINEEETNKLRGKPVIALK